MTAIAMGEALIELADGRKLRLAYDFDGMIALEETSGMKMRALYAELQRCEDEKEDPSFKLLRAIFYGGLQQHHPEITLKEVGNIILTDLDAILKAFTAFQGAHGPAGDGGPAGNASTDPRTRRGTGGSSSKAGAAPGSRRKASAGKRSGPTRKR